MPFYFIVCSIDIGFHEFPAGTFIHLFLYLNNGIG